MSEQYGAAFCRIYNELGWNYFPEAFGQQLLVWLKRKDARIGSSVDLACGTGVLCEILHAAGIRASGMDLSQGMIDVARERCGEIRYEVADMVTYRPGETVDLVTCTGDALNHIRDLQAVEQIFRNVYGYLNNGGYFIFDLLSEKEVPDEEPFDFDFSSKIRARFAVTQDDRGTINLKTTVFEDGEAQLEENITEVVHDVNVICGLLEGCGFRILQCGHRLLEDAEQDCATWFIAAVKENK